MISDFLKFYGVQTLPNSTLLYVCVFPDWTLSLCHYMHERAWRASAGSGGGYSSRASVSSGTSGGVGGGPSEESLAEIHRWKYMVNLSGWLYEVGRSLCTYNYGEVPNCYIHVEHL